MYSKINIKGHPIHPMFVSFPIAFYTAAFACFLAYQINGNVFWHNVGFISNIAGVATALLAAVPGILEWQMGIPKNTKAKKRGAIHGLLNVSALLFFAFNLYFLRGTMDNPPVTLWPLMLTGAGLILTVFAGWHGFALITHHKVGVDLTPQQEQIEASREKIEAA